MYNRQSIGHKIRGCESVQFLCGSKTKENLAISQRILSLDYFIVMYWTIDIYTQVHLEGASLLEELALEVEVEA